MYYIIEHPTRGVLMELDETDSGKVGRFSPTKSRIEALRFKTGPQAEHARTKITNGNPGDCVVMKSPAANEHKWTRSLLGPVEEPRN